MVENNIFLPPDEIIELRVKGRILFALHAALGDNIQINRLDELLSMALTLSDDDAEAYAKYYENFVFLRERMSDAVLDCIQKEAINGKKL